MNYMVVALIFLFVEIVSPEKKLETVLLDTIFADYDKRGRPIKDYHTPLVVNLSLAINQIIQVDEKHQTITTNILRVLYWKDDFLRWEPKHFGDIVYILTDANDVWTPDVNVYNSVASDMSGYVVSKNKNLIDNYGVVVNAEQMVVKTACKIDVTWFPFDEQKCDLIFGSWTSTSRILSLRVSERTSEANSFVASEEWNILAMTTKTKTHAYSCCPNDSFISINYTIHLKRRAFYYFFDLLVPCALIGFLAILGFTLPPESGEKLPLGASILFSQIVFLNTISGSMPANADTVPLLGTYFNCVMVTIALSVVSTIVVNLNLKAVPPKPVQGLSKKLFLIWLPWMLRISVSHAKTFANTNRISSNNRNVVDTITIQFDRCGRVDSVVTAPLYSDDTTVDQWRLVAAVVDKMCFIASLAFTFISVTVFLVYAF